MTMLMRRQEPLTISKRRRHAILNGYRSGLEETLSRQIAEAGLPVVYEPKDDKVSYTWPERQSTYLPDFKLPKPGGFWFLEGKGIFDVQTRQKHLLLKEQHPDLDVRFVFSNMNAKIYKGSPTTYAQWCEKHGFLYANRTIPPEWLQEGVNDNEPE